MLLVLVVSTHHPQVQLEPWEESYHERNQLDLAEQIMTIRRWLVLKLMSVFNQKATVMLLNVEAQLLLTETTRC